MMQAPESEGEQSKASSAMDDSASSDGEVVDIAELRRSVKDRSAEHAAPEQILGEGVAEEDGAGAIEVEAEMEDESAADPFAAQQQEATEEEEIYSDDGDSYDGSSKGSQGAESPMNGPASDELRRVSAGKPPSAGLRPSPAMRPTSARPKSSGEERVGSSGVDRVGSSGSRGGKQPTDPGPVAEPTIDGGVHEAQASARAQEPKLRHVSPVEPVRAAAEEVLGAIVQHAADRAFNLERAKGAASRGGAGVEGNSFPKVLSEADSSDEKNEMVKEFFELVGKEDLGAAKGMVFQNPWLINSVDSSERRSTPLHVSAAVGDEDMARFLLRQKPRANPVPRNALGRDPLHCAVAGGHVRVALAILEAGYCSVDARDVYGMTALHLACQTEPKEDFVQSLTVLILALMKAGFKKEARTSSSVQDLPLSEGFSAAPKETCLHLSARGLNLDALSLLLSSGSDLSKVSSLGHTALHCALAHPRDGADEPEAFDAFLGPLRPRGAGEFEEKDVLGCVRALVEAGVAVGTVDNKGKTALMQAAHLGYVMIVGFLMENGADVKAVDSSGKTALMYAAAGGSVHCVAALRREYAPSSSLQCAAGNTALHYAVMRGNMECVRSFLKFGSDANTKNLKGETPRDLAGDSLIGFTMQTVSQSAKWQVADPATQIQRVFRGHAGRKAFREYIDALSKVQLRPQYFTGAGKSQQKKLPRLPSSYDESESGAWSMMDLHSVIAPPEVEHFANRFHGGTEGAPAGKGEALPPVDRHELARIFEGKYASRSLFERFAQWRESGRKASPMLVYADLIALLDHTGLLGRHVSKSEVFLLFKREEPLQHGTSKNLSRMGREMGFTEFRAHMRALAGRVETQTLRILAQRTISSPIPSPGSTPRTESPAEASVQELPLAYDLPPAPPGLPLPPKILQSLNTGLWDYLPTISGVNGPKSSKRRRLPPVSEPSRSTSPTLSHALRSFSPVSASKVRVLPEAAVPPKRGRSRTASPTKSAGAGSPNKNKGSIVDYHEEGRASADIASTLATQHSTLSSSHSVDSMRSRLYTTKNTLSWEAKGCSQSRNEMALRSVTPTVANLSPWLKQVWIDYAPAVAGKPQLCDEAHEATYADCLEGGDYIGCYEVMTSSLHNIDRGAHPEVYERMHAQTLIFCNYYALRCLKARQSSRAIALLNKAEVLSTPGCGVDFPGRLALRGWTLDVFAYYYLTKGKTSAAKSYMSKAMQIIEKQSAEGRATWKSHFSAILSAAGKHHEAIEHAKDALQDSLADQIKDGMLTLDQVSSGVVPHAQRKLASAACFNLAVCKVQTNRLSDALTCTKMALVLGEDQFDQDGQSFVRMQGLHEALSELIRSRTASSSVRTQTPLACANPQQRPQTPAEWGSEDRAEKEAPLRPRVSA